MCFALAVAAAIIPARAEQPAPRPVSQEAIQPDVSVLAGKWTYRSFRNISTSVSGDPKKALELIFAEAVFTFEPLSSTSFKGSIDWADGGLDLRGTLHAGSGDVPASVDIVGLGRPNTKTAGWEYDYSAQLAHQWPKGVAQIPALVGSVIRAKPHGSAPAGYVASFIAVKQP
jgi:hypothetical protein